MMKYRFDGKSRFKQVLMGCVTVVSLSVLFSVQSLGAEKSFYAGKTLTLFVGFSPGGGVDTNARLVARHLTRQIPGEPKVIVKNMPGASGVLLANHLYHRAKPDGLAIGFPGRSYPLAPLLGDPGGKFDPLKFSFVGTVSQQTQVLFLRSDRGIKNLDELKRSKKTLNLPGLSPRSSNVMIPRVLAQYLGWPLNAIPGYTSTGKRVLAVEAGEGDGTFLNTETIEGARPDLVQSGFLIPIVQTRAYFKDVPLLDDHLTDEVKPLMGLIQAPSLWGVPLIGPPGIPQDRLNALRAAFMKMTEQEDFRRDAQSRGVEVQPLNGVQLRELIERIVKGSNDKVVAEYKKLMKAK